MPRRLRRTVSSLVVLVAGYWLYALIAVPLIEPSSARGDARRSTADERQAARDAPDKFRERLSALFPPGHWALDRPMVLKSRYGMLVMKDYEQREDGRLEIKPCALIFFRRANDGDAIPRDAIVLEAPEGALLRFGSGFQLAQAKFDKLKNCHLAGEITIRSQMERADASDDLLITARDVFLNEHLIRSDHPVRFRLGRSQGSGRDMVIRLMPMAASKARDRNLPNIGGIQSFELGRDVRMYFDMAQRGLLPGRADAAPNVAAAATGGSGTTNTGATRAPVEVTCQGSFFFDFVGHEASFDNQVDVMRLNPDGPSDQLRCELLSLMFEPKEEAGGAAGENEADEPSSTLPSLEPTLLVAKGQPVVVTSPSTGATARCDVLKYELSTGQITLDGRTPTPGQASETAIPAHLSQGPNEIRAPSIKYQPSERTGALGTLWAAGPGSIRAVPDAANPTSVFVAHWQTKLHLRRVKHEETWQQVVSLYGSPKVSVTGQGKVAAREIHLWLFEPGDRAAAQLARGGEEKVWVDRLQVLDANILESLWVQGKFDDLQVWFAHQLQPLDGTAAATESTGTASLAAGQGGIARAGTGQEPNNARAVREPLDVRGKRLLMKLATYERQSELTELTVTGSPAHVSARGVTLQSETIRLNRPENRLWCDHPGQLTLPVTQDFRGNKLAQTEPLTIGWQGRMEFEGERMNFYDQVVAHNRDRSQRLETGVLIGTLSERVQFDERQAGRQIDLRELACRDGVLMTSRTFDREGRPAFDRMQLASLQINLADRESGDPSAGEIYGAGPGWIKSTRYGSTGALAAADSPAGAVPTSSGDSQDRLNFLRVDFLREAIGNLHDKELTLVGQTEAIYGPVDTQQDELEGNSPAEIGPNGMILKSERLTVADMAIGSQEPMAVELQATGGVDIEGMSSGGQQYRAKGDQLSYDHRKGWLTLQGTERTDAAIYLPGAPNGQSGEQHSQIIKYSIPTGHLKLGGIRMLGGSQPAPIR